MDEKNTTQLQAVQKSYRIYATIIHWITLFTSIAALFLPIFILGNPSNNVLNPNTIFDAVFKGATPEQIWQTAGGFPGAHFYFGNLLKADSWAQITVVLGCSVGLWGLIPTVIYQIFKEKDYFYAVVGLVLTVLIALSMTGVLSIT